MTIRTHSSAQVLNIRSSTLSSRFARFFARATLVPCASLALVLAFFPIAGQASADPQPSASGGWEVCGAAVPYNPGSSGYCWGGPYSTSSTSLDVKHDYGPLGVTLDVRGGDSPSISMSSWANVDAGDWGHSGLTAGDDYYFEVVSSQASVKIDFSWTASHTCVVSGGDGGYDCNGGLTIDDVPGDVFQGQWYQFQYTSNGDNETDTLTGPHKITLTVSSNTWLRVHMWLNASTSGPGYMTGDEHGGDAWITESIDPTIKIDPHWLSDPNNHADVVFSTLSLPATPEPATTALVVPGTSAIAALRRIRRG